MSLLPPSAEGRPYRLWLRDDSGAASVVIWPDTWERLGFRNKIRPNTLLNVTLDVVNNSNTIEGNVAQPSDVRLISEEAAIAAPGQPQSPFRKLLQSSGSVNWLHVILPAGIIAFLLFRTRSKLLKTASERDRLRAEYEEGVARLTHLLGASCSVIYTLKPSSGENSGGARLTFISDSLEQMLGYETEYVYRTPEWWANNLHPDDRARVLEQQRRLFQDDVLDRHYRFRQRNGRYRRIHDQQKLLRDALGEPYEIVGTWFDVTEAQKENELKLALANLSELLSSAETPRDVSRIVLDAAAKLLASDCSFVSLYSEADQTQKEIFLYDRVDGKRQEVPVDPNGNPVTANSLEILQSGAKLILRTGNEGDHQGLDLIGSRRRSASLIFAPIRRAGHGIGLLSLQSYMANAYREQDLEILQVLADYCGAALARTFAEQSRRAMEEALRESEERYALALAGANDGLWDWNLKLNQMYFSARCSTMLGFQEGAFAGDPAQWQRLIHPDDADNVRSSIEAHIKGLTAQLEIEYRALQADGNYRWILLRGLAVHDQHGNACRMAGSQTDITERKRIEEQLEHGAYFDSLTGLPNRLLFMDHLVHAMARYKRHPESLFAVLFLDLDRFKVINDSLGHLAGDQLLIETARRLKECVRPEDVVARLGGDEFTILLENVANASDATCIAARIQIALNKTFTVEEHETHSTASIGIAFSRAEYVKPEEILRDADSAMYRAKQKGKATYELFDVQMHSSAMQVLSLDGELHRAMKMREFVVFYQPQVTIPSGRIIGLEALVRWQHPTRGLLSPGAFISQAEENGVIAELGLMVLNDACTQMRTWQAVPGMSSLTLSVNVSQRQLAVGTFVDDVIAVLESTAYEGSLLALELTETALMENADWVINTFERLKQSGIQLHMDDFGTGYSSLSYLHRFPIDALKIDRSFVNAIAAGTGNLQIVKAILALAESLDMEVIAEGIETSQELELLTSIGCKSGQGYLFGKPLSAKDITQLLALQRPLVSNP